MPFDFYYSVDSTPSRAVWATAKLLNIEFRAIDTKYKAGETKTPEYLKLNPSHTVPTIVDHSPDGKQLALFESRAILQYLLNRYAPNHRLYPADVQARAKIDEFLFWDASAYGLTVRKFVKAKLGLKLDPVPAELTAELEDKQTTLHAILGDKPFLTGSTLTIADISLAASYPWLQIIDLITPQIESWYQRVIAEVPQLDEVNAKTDVAKLMGIKA